MGNLISLYQDSTHDIQFDPEPNVEVLQKDNNLWTLQKSIGHKQRKFLCFPSCINLQSM